MSYLLENKEWIFSGIGVLVLSTIIGIVLYQIRKKTNKQKSNENMTKVTNRIVKQYGDKSIYNEENKGDITIN
jgi:uncharacterized protein (TIGR02588 family)